MTTGLYATFPGPPGTFPGHIRWFPGPFVMKILIFLQRQRLVHKFTGSVKFFFVSSQLSWIPKQIAWTSSTSLTSPWTRFLGILVHFLDLFRWKYWYLTLDWFNGLGGKISIFSSKNRSRNHLICQEMSQEAQETCHRVQWSSLGYRLM